MRKIFISLLLLALSSGLALAAIPDPAFNFVWETEPIQVKKGQEIEVTISPQIPQGYYIYAGKTDLEFITLEGIRVVDIAYPPVSSIVDPSGGLPVPVFKSDDPIKIKMLVPEGAEEDSHTVTAVLHYQGCSEAVCFPAQDKEVTWTFVVGDLSAAEATPLTEKVREGVATGINLLKGKGSNTVLSISLNLLYIIAFFGGVLSTFSPCILPLIPVTMLIIGVRAGRRWQDNFTLCLALVAGMALTYASLGVGAFALGKSIGFVFQSRLFIVFLVLFFLLMGLSMLDVFNLRLPQKLQQTVNHMGGVGPRGAFLTGISMGILATPCVGPVLGALIVYGASSRSFSVSFLLLLLYSLGLGAVILIAGTWYGTLVGRFKASGVVWVKRGMGLFLLGLALYYFHSLVPFTYLWKEASPIAWRHSYEALVNPAEERRPKMVLFTADWCPPCKVLESMTLKSSKIVELSKNFVAIKVDATTMTPENQPIIERYHVQGWPTILFLSPDGEVFEDLRIFGGYITADDLVEHMNDALSRE